MQRPVIVMVMKKKENDGFWKQHYSHFHIINMKKKLKLQYWENVEHHNVKLQCSNINKIPLQI